MSARFLASKHSQASLKAQFDVSGQSKDGIATYKIKITIKHSSKTRFKRFSEFVEFNDIWRSTHKLICNIGSECEVEKVVFPKKRLFGSASGAVIKKREEGLSKYLQQIGNDITVRPTLEMFLDISIEDMVRGNGIKPLKSGKSSKRSKSSKLKRSRSKARKLKRKTQKEKEEKKSHKKVASNIFKDPDKLAERLNKGKHKSHLPSIDETGSSERGRERTKQPPENARAKSPEFGAVVLSRLASVADSPFDEKLDEKDLETMPQKGTVHENRAKTFKAAFKQFDKDNSGTIDAAEFKQMVKVLAPELTEEEADQIMKDMDADNSGTIDFEEFLGFMLESSEWEPEDELDRAMKRCVDEGYFGMTAHKLQSYKKAFRLYDADGSGDIDPDEFLRVVAILEPDKTKEECLELMKTIDADGNGKIDFFEFLSHTLELKNNTADVHWMKILDDDEESKKEEKQAEPEPGVKQDAFNREARTAAAKLLMKKYGVEFSELRELLHLGTKESKELLEIWELINDEDKQKQDLLTQKQKAPDVRRASAAPALPLSESGSPRAPAAPAPPSPVLIAPAPAAVPPAASAPNAATPAAAPPAAAPAAGAPMPAAPIPTVPMPPGAPMPSVPVPGAAAPPGAAKPPALLPPPIGGAGLPPALGLFGAGGGGKPPKPGPVPSQSMKTVHWKKLADKELEGTIWDNFEGTFELDWEGIQNNFHQKIFKKKLRRSLAQGGAPEKKEPEKPKQVLIIDGKRTLTVLIALNRFKMTAENIVAAIYSCDEKTLDEEATLKLMNFVPSTDEYEMVKAYTGDPTLLGECERFFLAIGVVPVIKKRLALMAFKAQFRETIDFLISRVNIVELATQEVRNSQHFITLMEMVLSLGNFLNSGKRNGGAYGIPITSLQQLNMIKSTNNKMTLMAHFTTLVNTYKPEARDFIDEFVHVERSTKIVTGDSTAELGRMHKALNMIAKMTKSPPASEEDKFNEVMNTFREDALERYQEAKETVVKIYDDCTAVMKSFGETKLLPEEFFKVLLDFVVSYKKGEELIIDIEKKEEEKKKKEQQEKKDREKNEKKKKNQTQT